MTTATPSMTTTLQPAQRFRIPSLAARLVVGGLLFVGMVVLFVVIPFEVLKLLPGYGVHSPVSMQTVTVIGILVAALTAATYVLKPSRAYGPLGVATALATVGYLLSFLPAASLRVGIGNGVTLTIYYGTILLLLTIVPILGAVAAAVTSYEDASRPGERLPYDFPA
jgi:hypothetical protein